MDSVLTSFTYSGESKLSRKSFKLTDLSNVCDTVYAVFVYASKEEIKNTTLPLLGDVQKALSNVVRHASERLERKNRTNKKHSQKENLEM